MICVHQAVSAESKGRSLSTQKCPEVEAQWLDVLEQGLDNQLLGCEKSFRWWAGS